MGLAPERRLSLDESAQSKGWRRRERIIIQLGQRDYDLGSQDVLSVYHVPVSREFFVLLREYGVVVVQ